MKCAPSKKERASGRANGFPKQGEVRRDGVVSAATRAGSSEAMIEVWGRRRLSTKRKNSEKIEWGMIHVAS